jgi:hypothetical protein
MKFNYQWRFLPCWILFVPSGLNEEDNNDNYRTEIRPSYSTPSGLNEEDNNDNYRTEIRPSYSTVACSTQLTTTWSSS